MFVVAAWALLALIGGYLILAAIYGRAGLLEILFGPIERQPPVDFAALRLRPSPNQYLVCPPGLGAARPHAESPHFDVSLDQLRAAWFRTVDRQPRTTLLQSDASAEQYDYRVLTPVIHFPDTVTVRLLSAGGGATIAIYSRSHYGYSDLGVNRRRVQSWLVQLQDEIAGLTGNAAAQPEN
jgi:uncharacterized protein (DUF1499 family)